MKKFIGLFLLAAFATVLIACDNTDLTTTGGSNTTTIDVTSIVSDTGLDPNVEGIVDIVLWSGSGATYYDLGHQDLTADDLPAQNDAAAYAVAKAFNAIYPNVTINGYFRSGGPDGWSQVLETYRDDNGRFPAVWASRFLSDDVEKGLVADLSRFEDDPLYQMLNPSIMKMMNYYGFQAGLPQYILPWGMYVNKTLADEQGIVMPGPDWDIDEYTEFVSNYSTETDNLYFGAMDVPLRLIESGTNTITEQLHNYDGGDSFIDLNSTEVRGMIHYLHDWAGSSFWGLYDIETETLGAELAAASGPLHQLNTTLGWDYNFFREGYLLTLEYEPWMMGDCADPDGSAPCIMDDWDIYPRPATDYNDNTIGVVLDPMAVYNYCIDDGDLACSAEEELKIQIAYTFAIFWCADNRSFYERSEQMYSTTDTESGEVYYSSALNDSFPAVTGEMFDFQMDYWYKPAKHQRFNAVNNDGDYLMPGFQEVVRIYNASQHWEVSDKSFPWQYSSGGQTLFILNEWLNYYNPDINGGVSRDDAAFESTILSLLPTWNQLVNERWASQFESLQESLTMYYGFTEDDFSN
ncbi:MAG: hypothetical protein WC509_07370 [Candidatus Izemoplasmatales bacterium]